MSLSLRKQIAGLPPPTSSGKPQPRHGRPGHDFTPILWSKFFDEKQHVRVDTDGGSGGEFCVYFRYKQDVASTFPNQEPVIVFLHGGGFSGLTWATTINCASSILNNVQMVAIDLRGHGETHTNNDENLSLETLTSDILQVIRQLELHEHPLVLVGHSLGGSLATNVAKEIEEGIEMKVVALLMIDIVEGSAIEALSTMRSGIRGRPVGFESIDKAIEWSLKSGQVRDHESCRVSMPGQLKYTSTGASASEVLESSTANTPEETSSPQPSFQKPFGAITEEESEEESEGTKPHDQSSADSSARDHVIPDVTPIPTWKFTWRIDLLKTEQYWLGWFQGLSARFLQISCPKYLILAGVDRLDRELTIAQMQGQFQMAVLPAVGHSVHEDVPLQVADALCSFLIRHKLATAK